MGYQMTNPTKSEGEGVDNESTWTLEQKLRFGVLIRFKEAIADREAQNPPLTWLDQSDIYTAAISEIMGLFAQAKQSAVEEFAERILKSSMTARIDVGGGTTITEAVPREVIDAALADWNAHSGEVRG